MRSRSVIEGTKLTARFGSGGEVSGDAGWQLKPSGPDTSSGTRLRIGPLAATQRACVGAEGIDAQEAGYLAAALESARRFEQQGSQLTIFDEQGRMAVTSRPR